MLMQEAQSLESQAFILRKKLDKLRHDVNKHRTPLELRIARTLFDERCQQQKNKGNVLKLKNKNSRKNSSTTRQRPAWGSGGGVQHQNNTTGGWHQKEIFATASKVDIEYDDAVLIGRNPIEMKEAESASQHTGPKWHVVMGSEARDVLMLQSNKLLGEAYEHLKKNNRDTEYPGLIPSETSSEYDEHDSERGKDIYHVETNEPVRVMVTDKVERKNRARASGVYIPMRENATSAEMLKAEAHQWLHRGRELLKYRLQQVHKKLGKHEEKMQHNK